MTSAQEIEVPAVSIIIPTLNEEWYLPLLLRSLETISSPLDVIVVDGKSEDKTAQVVEEFQSRFTGLSSLRLFSSERGISLQRNRGAQEARHHILIFCDADVVMPSAEAHTLIVSEFSRKGYVAAAPVLIPIESRWDVHLAQFIATATQRILLLFGKPYFGGAYLITTKDAFARLGGFDVNVLLGEDVDYSLRASKLARADSSSLPSQSPRVDLSNTDTPGFIKNYPICSGLFLLERLQIQNESIILLDNMGNLRKVSEKLQYTIRIA